MAPALECASLTISFGTDWVVIESDPSSFLAIIAITAGVNSRLRTLSCIWTGVLGRRFQQGDKREARTRFGCVRRLRGRRDDEVVSLMQGVAGVAGSMHLVDLTGSVSLRYEARGILV